MNETLTNFIMSDTALYILVFLVALSLVANSLLDRRILKLKEKLRRQKEIRNQGKVPHQQNKAYLKLVSHIMIVLNEMKEHEKNYEK